ncbi:hypothetical protein GALMADRAFT_131501 [Galerina marginata CBS 339.88]|uniref:F-box domain-containing protein n=1 Tax=Galerina marginata (strain CBS 339.88) TaxID=685588 RepID=A0A067TXI1_GALM3|nr:hypothetical protein GALMADRAFT_131501 [Galerina marginata CBS 339.88]
MLNFEPFPLKCDFGLVLTPPPPFFHLPHGRCRALLPPPRLSNGVEHRRCRPPRCKGEEEEERESVRTHLLADNSPLGVAFDQRHASALPYQTASSLDDGSRALPHQLAASAGHATPFALLCHIADAVRSSKLPDVRPASGVQLLLPTFAPTSSVYAAAITSATKSAPEMPSKTDGGDDASPVPYENTFDQREKSTGVLDHHYVSHPNPSKNSAMTGMAVACPRTRIQQARAMPPQGSEQTFLSANPRRRKALAVTAIRCRLCRRSLVLCVIVSWILEIPGVDTHARTLRCYTNPSTRVPPPPPSHSPRSRLSTKNPTHLSPAALPASELREALRRPGADSLARTCTVSTTWHSAITRLRTLDDASSPR